MRPATGQRNARAACVGKRPIGGVAIALQRAGEVRGNELVQARGGAAGFPTVKHIPTGTAAGPEIALPGPALTGGRISSRMSLCSHVLQEETAF